MPGSTEWGSSEWGAGDESSLWTIVTPGAAVWSLQGAALPPSSSEWISEWGLSEWGAGGASTGPWTLIQPGASLWTQT